MSLIEQYISYIKTVRRYSPRTVEIYTESLENFARFISEGQGQKSVKAGGQKQSANISDNELLDNLIPSRLRSYEVYLLDERKLTPRSVNLHISVLSSFCNFLMKRDYMTSNPAKNISRPKAEIRLPEFYGKDVMDEYFRNTEACISEDGIYLSPDRKLTQKLYEQRLRRLIVSMLYNTGIRRSELISMNRNSVDFSRKTAKIRGKGDKIREIPLISSLCKEISLYLQAVETMVDVQLQSDSALLLTFSGKRLYPVYVDRAIKSELGETGSITGRKSPHVLRHSLATELLNEGTELNSIKELLGHSSLATTQIYTHNSIAKLKKVYETAHPRASKNGGKHGD